MVESIFTHPNTDNLSIFLSLKKRHYKQDLHISLCDVLATCKLLQHITPQQINIARHTIES